MGFSFHRPIKRGRKILVATETDALTVAKQSITQFYLTLISVPLYVTDFLWGEKYTYKNSVISVSDAQVLY